jgi:hypothetical protein
VCHTHAQSLANPIGCPFPQTARVASTQQPQCSELVRFNKSYRPGYGVVERDSAGVYVQEHARCFCPRPDGARGLPLVMFDQLAQCVSVITACQSALVTHFGWFRFRCSEGRQVVPFCKDEIERALFTPHMFQGTTTNKAMTSFCEVNSSEEEGATTNGS